MTLGDVIWAALDPPHLRIYRVAHGTIMCLVFGLASAGAPSSWRPAPATGPIIGLFAALVFYALAGPLRFAALLPAWMSFWIMFAFFPQWLSRTDSPAITVLRRVVSGVLSGLAFVAISGI